MAASGCSASLITVALAIVAWLALRLGLAPRRAEPELAAGVAAAPPAPGRAGREPRRGRPPAPRGCRRIPPMRTCSEPVRRLDRRDALHPPGARGVRARLPPLAPGPAARPALRRGLPRALRRRVPQRLAERLERATCTSGPTRCWRSTSSPAASSLADPNKVVGSVELDAPSPVLAVAPRRASVGYDRSIAFTGDGGATIVATDAETGEEVARWSAGGPIAALAYDAEAPRLLVGRADSGTVETYELAGLMASPDGRAPPAGPPIESGLETREPRSSCPPSRATRSCCAGTGRRGRRRAGHRRGRRGTIEGAFGGVGYVAASTTRSPDWVVATDPVARRHRLLRRRARSSRARRTTASSGRRARSSARSSCAASGTTQQAAGPHRPAGRRPTSTPRRPAASPSWTPTAATVAAAGDPCIARPRPAAGRAAADRRPARRPA